jgi:Uma2 family endonuclease
MTQLLRNTEMPVVDIALHRGCAIVPPMSSERKMRLTPEEYLALERKADVRSEYLDGDMVAMSGGSREHNLVVSNIVRELGIQLRGRPCEVYPSDMRVKVHATGLYTYPDVTVMCGEAQLEDERRDTLLNPVVIFEVLSGSTESYDRGAKFAHYRKIPSLVEYVLVSQREYIVEHYIRQPDGPWLRSEARGLSAKLDLPSIQSSIDLSRLYERIEIR